MGEWEACISIQASNSGTKSHTTAASPWHKWWKEAWERHCLHCFGVSCWCGASIPRKVMLNIRGTSGNNSWEGVWDTNPTEHPT